MQKLIIRAVMFIGIIALVICVVAFSFDSNNPNDALANNTDFQASLFAVEKEHEEKSNAFLEYNNKPINAAQYYEEYAQIISIESLENAADIQSGKEVEEELRSRGFDQYGIVAPYDELGGLNNGDEDTPMVDRHAPIFLTYYLTESEDLWTVSIINGHISAYPVSFNLRDEAGIEVLLTETETVMSYDGLTRTFFETIPDPSELIIKKIKTIDADHLEELSWEAINEL